MHNILFISFSYVPLLFQVEMNESVSVVNSHVMAPTVDGKAEKEVNFQTYIRR